MNADLVSRIQASFPTFSKGQKKIANTILTSYDKAAYMTAVRLGELVGVSESTVVRFATELGYSGYPDLQRAVQELVRTKLTSNQRIEATNNRLGGGDVLDMVLSSDVEKIKYTLDNIDRKQFAGAVEAIKQAKHIYIIGVRSSSNLASALYYNLSMMFNNVRLVQTTSGSELFEQLIQLEPGDVMIAISFPRYSKRVINAVEFAGAQGATVISLTDSVISPIASGASYLLVAQSDMASFVDSLVAPLSVINALIVALTKDMQRELKERFDKLEHIWSEYDVYATK